MFPRNVKNTSTHAADEMLLKATSMHRHAGVHTLTANHRNWQQHQRLHLIHFLIKFA